MHYITNIQKFSIHDGDGIRTTVFFKGCKLRCQWCHNPETQNFKPEIQYDQGKCTGCGRCIKACPNGALSFSPAAPGEAPAVVTDASKCQLCGRCVDVCPQCARDIIGKEYSVPALVKEIMKDRMFYEDSGGGVTLSGGEVMAMDREYLVSLCQALHRQGIDITIDTCGEAPWETYEAIAPYVHTWLYDIKTLDDDLHRKYIGAGNQLILDNLKKLAAAGERIYIRIPVVKEVNGTEESMRDVIRFLGDNHITPPQINLLPYHDTGKSKYPRLGRRYEAENLHAPDKEEMQSFVKMFNEAGYGNVKIGG